MAGPGLTNRGKGSDAGDTRLKALFLTVSEQFVLLMDSLCDMGRAEARIGRHALDCRLQVWELVAKCIHEEDRKELVSIDLAHICDALMEAFDL